MSNKMITIIMNALVRILGIDHDHRRQDQPILITTFEPMHYLLHVSFFLLQTLTLSLAIIKDMISIPLVLLCY